MQKLLFRPQKYKYELHQALPLQIEAKTTEEQHTMLTYIGCICSGPPSTVGIRPCDEKPSAYANIYLKAGQSPESTYTAALAYKENDSEIQSKG